MEQDDAGSIIREIVEVGWNRADLSVIDARIATDFVRHTFLGDLVGPEVFKSRIRALRAAFDEFHTEIHEVGGDKSRGFGRFTVTGRHTGEYFSYPATGNRIEFVGAVIGHARDGQLVEEWEFFDTTTLLAQISTAS